MIIITASNIRVVPVRNAFVFSKRNMIYNAFLCEYNTMHSIIRKKKKHGKEHGIHHRLCKHRVCASRKRYVVVKSLVYVNGKPDTPSKKQINDRKVINWRINRS